MGRSRKGDYVLKPDAKSRFGKLLKKYAPYVGDEKGPRFRLWRFDTPREGAAIAKDELKGRFCAQAVYYRATFGCTNAGVG